MESPLFQVSNSYPSASLKICCDELHEEMTKERVSLRPPQIQKERCAGALIYFVRVHFKVTVAINLRCLVYFEGTNTLSRVAHCRLFITSFSQE